MLGLERVLPYESNWNMRNKLPRHLGAFRCFGVGVIGSLTLLLAAPLGFAQGGRSIQRFGSITLSSESLSYVPGVDGRLHVIMSGNPVLTAELRTMTGTIDRYEIRASRTIDYTLAAGNLTLANAVADGAVHIEVHSPLLPQAGGGERVLVVTGAHGVFNNQPQSRTETADITGNPQITLYDPQLASPAVLSNAVSIHVDLLTRQFQVLGDANHRPTMTVEPKQTRPVAPNAGHVRFLRPQRPLQAAIIPTPIALRSDRGRVPANR